MIFKLRWLTLVFALTFIIPHLAITCKTTGKKATFTFEPNNKNDFINQRIIQNKAGAKVDAIDLIKGDYFIYKNAKTDRKGQRDEIRVEFIGGGYTRKTKRWQETLTFSKTVREFKPDTKRRLFNTQRRLKGRLGHGKKHHKRKRKEKPMRIVSDVKCPKETITAKVHYKSDDHGQFRSPNKIINHLMGLYTTELIIMDKSGTKKGAFVYEGPSIQMKFDDAKKQVTVSWKTPAGTTISKTFGDKDGKSINLSWKGQGDQPYNMKWYFFWHTKVKEENKFQNYIDEYVMDKCWSQDKEKATKYSYTSDEMIARVVGDMWKGYVNIKIDGTPFGTVYKAHEEYQNLLDEEHEIDMELQYYKNKLTY